MQKKDDDPPLGLFVHAHVNLVSALLLVSIYCCAILHFCLLDIMDPALLQRPGCLDRKIRIPLPNEQARVEILKIHAAEMSKHVKINYDAAAKLAEVTPSSSSHLCKSSRRTKMSQPIAVGGHRSEEKDTVACGDRPPEEYATCGEWPLEEYRVCRM